MKLIERACSLNTEVKYWVALYFLKEKIYNKEKAIPLMEDAMILNDKLKKDYAIRLFAGIPEGIETDQERAKQLICEVDNGKIETSFAESYLKIETEKLRKEMNR